MEEYKITDEQRLSVSLGKFNFRAGPFAAHSRGNDYCTDYLNPLVLVSVYQTREARVSLQAVFVCYAKKNCFQFVYRFLRSAFSMRSRVNNPNTLVSLRRVETDYT